MSLEYISLIILICVFMIFFYGIIAIHDIPYEMAKKRNHPHQDAIHYAGWVSLFTLHVLWPFLWIWAALWRDDRGWGMQSQQFQMLENEHQEVERLNQEVKNLKQEIAFVKEQITLKKQVAKSSELKEEGEE